MAIRVFVSSQMAVHLQSGKKLRLALIPLPQSTPLAASSSLPPSVFWSTSLFSPSLSLCRRFDIGNTVSALHGNNSGKDDINYLPIV